MNRTATVGLMASFALFSALAACGGNDSAPPPAATGGTTGAGGAVDPDAGDDSSAAGGAGDSDVAQIDGDDAMPVTGDYYPFQVGDSWEYQVTQPNKPTVNKVHKITRMEPVGGTGPFKDVVAFRVETQKASDATLADATISWQLREGNRIVRYRETSCQAGSVKIADGAVTECAVNEEDWWMPARAVLDEMPSGMPYAVGLKWPEIYMEWIVTSSFKTIPPTMLMTSSMQTDTWEIVNPSTTFTTPAGTFSDCAMVKKTSMKGAAKQYTFCRGIGKAKEEPLNGGTGQTELLTKYTVL